MGGDQGQLLERVPIPLFCGSPSLLPLGLVSPPRSSELTMGFASVTAKAKAIAPGVFFPRVKTTVSEAAAEPPAPNETAR